MFIGSYKLCLHVRAKNPVINLYQCVGFVKVAGSEIVNRVGGISFNMVYKFNVKAYERI